MKRKFVAGTWHYFCEIHPTQMRGVIDVPVTLRRNGPKVSALWGAQSLPAGQVFDVQEKVGRDAWKTVRNGTRSVQGSFAPHSGQLLQFRARVREKADSSAASGYSPPARIRLG